MLVVKSRGIEFWPKVLMTFVTLDKWYNLMSLSVFIYKTEIISISLGSFEW